MSWGKPRLGEVLAGSFPKTWEDEVKFKQGEHLDTFQIQKTIL